MIIYFVRRGVACFFILVVFYGPFAHAAPSFDRNSEGAVLAKTRQGMFLSPVAVVDYEDISERDSYKVELSMPTGRKIPLPLQGTIVDNKKGLYWPASLLSVDEDYQKGVLVGDYVFELKDAEGTVVDSYVDFLIPYRDDAYQEMGDFEDAGLVPQDGSQVKQGDLAVKWNPVREASKYRVAIFKDNTDDFANVVFRAVTEKTEVVVPAEKLQPGKYVLKLDAFHEKDPKDWNNMVRHTLEDGALPVFYVN